MNEIELSNNIKCSLERGMGIWETWNPKNYYYLYDDYFGSYEEDSRFELNDNGLRFYLVNDKRGYRITLTFDLNNIFKIIGTDESYRWVSYRIGIDTIENQLKETKIFKASKSYFQNYYYENFKDELKDKILNYFITGCSNYIFETFCVEEPKISFDTFKVEKKDEVIEETIKYDYFDDEVKEYIGKLYNYDEIILPFDNYILESFNLKRDYYVFVLYGENTNKRYKITFYYNNVRSVMINRRKYFKGKYVECEMTDEGIRIFYEIEDSEFFEWYKQEEFWGCGADDLRHIRFNGCDNFIIDFIFDCCEIGVMEI
ncbi:MULTISPECIES: hypothetical protein [unclassified Parvimonas]|uniref:hypothetical protein n=1 Tax=unclassified Parvimonas TaxID=1151464 RepID=UPI002B47082C|nr:MULTISPECIES: hypothetical protein [unclassified Parvimonas]MEB3025762.1 hypothetical protein [Parvimonas sp. M13]MEB3072841.1 hypothetical protein [Parvimonas sp. C2]MEB3089880.1 hypothetical protein [Parvimonas sp. M20]